MTIDQEFNEDERVMNPGGKSAARAAGMTNKEFDELVADAFERIPEKFRLKVKNVALLVEDGPSQETLRENDVPEGETLLGLYHGIPATERGSGYGVGATLPDTITVYRKPVLAAAAGEADADFDWGPPTERMKGRIRDMIRDTIWHEIAHYFGMDEYEVDARETDGTNEFKP